MKRIRRLGQYKGHKPHVYGSIGEFLSSVLRPGVHSFHANNHQVDLLYIEAESDTILVMFPAALEGNAITVPYFSGIGIAAQSGVSLLSVADPAHSMDGSIATNWCLGDAEYRFHEDLLKIIKHVTRARRIIFMGASAGGFPALYYGTKFLDSISVPINPRTDLLTPPTHLQFSGSRLFPGIALGVLPSLVPTALERAENQVFFLQNARDYRYYSAHMIPYMLRNENNANVSWKLCNWGDGHFPAPQGELVDIVFNLALSRSWREGVKTLGGKAMGTVSELRARHADVGLALPLPAN